MPALDVTTSPLNELAVDTAIIAVFDASGFDAVDAALEAVGLDEALGSTAVVPAPDGFAARKIVAVRLPENYDAAGLRRAIANGVRAAGAVETIAIQAPLEETGHVELAGAAAALAAYTFAAYKSEPKTAPQAITLVVPRMNDSQAAGERAKTIADAVAQARDWVNMPPGDLRPNDFANQIAERAQSLGVTATIWDETKLKRERCGGILGVGRGSEAPPRLVTLQYAPAGATKHLALVGKGITFDSGGLSIKPGASMMTMKCDMAGAATVAAATLAIAALGLNIKVTAYAALAENMPSGSATRPGDVLTMRNGKTVEIHNTDAEGRLVLADALSLATESDADEIIDVATLTGACMVALGSRTAGLFSTDDAYAVEVKAAAETATEHVWPLPLTEELLARACESSVADIRQHNPKPAGGAIFAAAFLRQFVDDRPWAHLDIAGPAFNEDAAYDDVSVGGTGMGVRTLIQHAMNRAS